MGCLRQYFPKGTDLGVHTAADLEFVAAQLNSRPRKTLGFDTPAERMAQLLGLDSKRPIFVLEHKHTLQRCPPSPPLPPKQKTRPHRTA